MTAGFSIVPSQSVTSTDSIQPLRGLTNTGHRQTPPLSNVTFGRQKKGPKIPQTRDRAWVPQGLDFLPTVKWFIISSYFNRGRGSEGKASKLSAVDIQSGKKIKTVDLYESRTQKHIGHVGGVTSTKDHIFVASTSKGKNFLLRYLTADFVNAKQGEKLIPDQVYLMPHRTSYVKYNPFNDRLYIGEWVHSKRKPAGKLHSYPMDSSGDLDWSRHEKMRTPPDVQGIEFLGSNEKIYSRSKGRRHLSSLDFYNNLKRIKEVTLPPMSQGIVVIRRDNNKQDVHVLSESGAAKYQKGGIDPRDRLMIMPIKTER